MTDLTRSQTFLLDWLSKEDVSPLGECRGADLDALVAAGLARVREDDPRGDDYNGVSVTDAGLARLDQMRRAHQEALASYNPPGLQRRDA